ncbi:hypothetical protein F4825DRAFT_153591 [Nemania diffusa]|nr:hypothetical protein F4825DRAFT_153591 [Nemania diffusa]
MNSHPGSRGSAPMAAAPETAVAVAVAVAVGEKRDVVGRGAATPAARTKTTEVAGAATTLRDALQGTLRGTLLNRSGSCRGPLGTPRITGPASAAAAAASRSRSSYRSSWTYRAVIFLLISFWACLSITTAAASAISLDESPRPTPTPTSLALSGTQKETEPELETEPEILLIDTRIPVFLDGHWQIMSNEEHGELRRRGAASKETTWTAPTATTTEVVIDTSTVTATADPVTTTTAASPLPSPFDGALAANFSTQSCPVFINEFLSNATFKSCYPISLLLQGSQSFFEAETNFVTITRVLDAACAANLTMCTDYLNGLASSLIDDSNCGREYERQNALVVLAYKGMKTYETVYRATCLTDKDSNSSSYCFANAITNASTASNSYLYYLPFNSSLPSNAVPACGSCTQQTMQIYQAATSDRKADISNTYLSAADQINMNCGSNFINTTLAVAVNSSATLDPMSSSSLFLFSFIFMAISHWIL